MKHIRTIGFIPDTDQLRMQLIQHPTLWNRHTGRTAPPQSPHHQIDDIWARYATPGANPKEPKAIEWYGEILEKLPALMPIIARIEKLINSQYLGGILITRIPAGKKVLPHIDRGWHADFYTKYAVQIAAHPAQAFCYADGEHVTRPGDLYTFDNSHSHWVKNPSDEERITLIVCARPFEHNEF
jgi:hypothetical protein